MDDIERERLIQAEQLWHSFKAVDVVDGLKGKSIAEVFSNEEAKREFLSTMTDQDFVSFISGVNGIILGKNKDSWGLSEEGVHLAGCFETIVPPHPKDKPELIRHIMNATQRMNADGRGLSDIALMVSVTINSVHPWQDGNGRTTRVLYSLITENEKEVSKDEIIRLLSEDGRDMLTTDSRAISVPLMNIVQADSGIDFHGLYSEVPTAKFSYKTGVEESQKEQVAQIYKASDESRTLSIAVMSFLRERTDRNSFFREFPGGRIVVEFDKLISTLESEGIEAFLLCYWEVKKSSVDLLIDCIENPDKEKYKIKSKDGSTKMTLYEKLKQGVVRSE